MLARARLSFVLALVIPFAACSKSDKDKGGDKAADNAASADKPAEGAPADGPVALDAKALFDDFNKPGQDGLALLDKYRPGVIVTGTVSNTITEMDNSMSVWLDIGAEHKMSLGFKDNGAAAAKAGVKAGQAFKAQCSVGGSDGHLMMLTDCVAK